MKARSCHKNSLAVVVVLLAILLRASAALAQSSSFTYQGRLTDSGTAANGNYDLQFTLWDSLSGGTQIGSTQSLNTIAVSNGTFTVSLDFGASSFPGANRFLEISARPSGAGSFTLLTPRQQVTSTPYAVRSVSAGNADTATNATTATNAAQLGGFAASQYVRTSDSRLSDARTPTSGSSNYIQNTSNQQASTNFNVSGTGSAGILNATTQVNLNGIRAISGPGNTGNGNFIAGFGAGNSDQTKITGSGNALFGNFAGQQITSGDSNSFFGTQAGQSNSMGRGNSFLGSAAGLVNTSGSSNSFFGSSAGAQNTIGNDNSYFGEQAGQGAIGNLNTFLGFQAKFDSSNATGDNDVLLGAGASAPSGINNATAIGAFARVTQSNSLVLGSINGEHASADTNVGIGTTAPQARFHVNGTGWFSFDTTPLPSLAGKGTAIGFVPGSDAGYVFAYDYFATTGKNLLLNQFGGRVGVGTAAPDQLLSVNGNASKVGGGSWLTFSDERLKNIKGHFSPGLNAVMQLQPLRYKYKPDNALNLKSEGEHIGFSAQAVQKIIPEAVSKNDQGYLLVNNDPIIWTMLNAIKEQEVQIETLRRLNSTLNARLNKLERTRKKSIHARRK